MNILKLLIGALGLFLLFEIIRFIRDETEIEAGTDFDWGGVPTMPEPDDREIYKTEEELYNELTEVEMLARTIYGEARGSSQTEQEMVGHVIMNRLEDWGYNSIHDTVLDRFQFEAWGVPSITFDANQKAVRNVNIEGDPAYNTAKSIAEKVMSRSSRPAPLRNCQHFVSRRLIYERDNKIVLRASQNWMVGMEIVWEGDHVFLV